MGVGGGELFNADPGPGLVTSRTIYGLPIDGSTIYVRLYSYTGSWASLDYTYTAAGPATIYSPPNGSMLTGSSVTFQWTTGTGVTQYWLSVSKVGVGGGELFNADPGPGLVTFRTVTGLPTDGSIIYVRLYSHIGGTWPSLDYTYSAAGGASVPATITSPPNGSTLPGSSVTFQWTTGTGVTQYWLSISKVGVGGGDLFNADPGPGLVTSRTITGLPNNGSTIYVSLYSHIGSTWPSLNYTYSAAGSASPTSNPNSPNLPDTDVGKGPPPASASPCGVPNCSWNFSSITYVSPAQMYGYSGTYTTGPDGPFYTNHTSARLINEFGQDLGLACSGESISYGSSVAYARVPCDSQVNFYLYAPHLYTLIGRHQTNNGSYTAGVFQTFDSLGFVPAGASWDFTGLPMGPFSDFRYSAGPTIAPSNDGVTVRYTAHAVSTVSVHIDAPYSARKGRHQLGFPTYDIYGFPAANEFFAIIIYDPTPVIATVSPSSIPQGTPTTLTIAGTGFGDHPTVFVGGTAYNPGAPSRNAQGQDVLNLSISPPLFQSNSPVSVYLVSNGAGGQAFFGSPQGSQRGTSTSNTKQVQAPSPTILSMSPRTLQVGTSGVQFTISGTFFGAAMPTLSFGTSGITNVVITGNSDTQVTGTVDVPPTALPGQFTVTLTPSGRTQNATTNITLTPAPPTMSGAGGTPFPGGTWWFGSDFVANNGYYNAVQLDVQAGAGGSAPSIGAPAVWTLTANSDKASLNCTDASCASVILTSLGPTLPCNDPGTWVKVRVTLGGVSSADFPLAIDEPDSLEVIPNADGQVATDLGEFGVGYRSLIIYQVRSKCSSILYHPSVNEEFTSMGRYTQTSNNWPFLSNDDTSFLHFWDTDNGFGTDNFVDTLAFADSSGVYFPPPQIPGPLRTPPVPLSTIPLIWQTQRFRIGSTTIGKGVLVQQNTQTSYQDHGRSEGAFKP